MLPNGFEFPLAWQALAKLGAVMVPVNVQYREKELQDVLNHSEAKLAVVGMQQVEVLQRAQPQCNFLRAMAVFANEVRSLNNVVDLRSEMEQAPTNCVLDAVDQDDLLNLQYTSGTTGFPKACMLTHKYWLQLAQDALAYGKIRSDDVNLTAQPFYYMDPQWNLVLCMLAGIPLVILRRFSASTFWQSVQENAVTFFYLIGTMPVYLLKQPENPQFEKNHRVRFVFCSGIVPQLHATFESRWGMPWRELYGSTESGGDLQVPLENADGVGAGTVGISFPGKEAKVIDANDHELPDGEVGELVVRGEPMMLGYYKNSAATKEKIRHGWLHTGDLFRKDKHGYFYLVGRLKDMVRRSGENISAAEVEGVLCEHPAVRAAAVVPVPDDLRGEEVKAFIQLQNGETLDPEELLAFAQKKLAAFKMPRFIEVVERFPMTPSERIAKHELLKSKPDQRKGAYDAVIKQWG